MTRAIRAEAIAAFEQKVDQLDALTDEIAEAENRLGDLARQRDRLMTGIETICELLGWQPAGAVDTLRRDRVKRLQQGDDQASSNTEKSPGPDLLSGVAP